MLMKQMQDQQKGLQRLIQEFRDNNAEKLIQENYELQDRLYKLELDEQDMQNQIDRYPAIPDANYSKHHSLHNQNRFGKVK